MSGVGGAELMGAKHDVVSAGRKKKEKEDTFGQNDEDWHIYREIVSCTNRIHLHSIL